MRRSDVGVKNYTVRIGEVVDSKSVFVPGTNTQCMCEAGEASAAPVVVRFTPNLVMSIILGNVGNIR